MNRYCYMFKESKFFISILLSFIINIGLLKAGGSPIQPDFSNFEPVSTDNMVNEFDGSFVYNLPILTVPGPNGSSYSITLSYHSGLSPEADASWVGYGWTLNPGSIFRNTKGYPDDYYQTDIKFWNKVEPNTTLAVGVNVMPEIFSHDFPVSIGGTFQYNSYKGFFIGTNIGIDLAGYLNLGFGLTSEGTLTGSFSHIGHPTRLLNDLYSIGRENILKSENLTASDYKLLSHLNNIFSNKYSNGFGFNTTIGYPSKNSSMYHGINVSGEIKLDGMTLPMLGMEGGVSVEYSKQTTPENEIKQACGFLYTGSANKNNLMDYTVEKDTDYHTRKKFLGIPVGNADYYSVTGEGVSGTFRAYNKNIGIFYPKEENSTSEFLNLGYAFDIGGFSIGWGIQLKLGFNVYNYGGWRKFQDYEYLSSKNNYNYPIDEPFFFRFANDFASNIDFSKSYSFNDDHKVVSLDLNSNILTNSTYNIYNYILNKNKRPERSAFISYNTFEDFETEYNQNTSYNSTSLSGEFGSLFPKFLAYNKTNPIIKNLYSQNLSTYSKLIINNDRNYLNKQILEFSITNNEGKNYIYGLPVFCRNEADLSYGIPTDRDYFLEYNNNQIYFGATPTHNTDKVVGEERNSPYISMYLLTSIATTDYIDRNQDGFTPDDYGAYTLFGYNKTAGTDWKASISDKDWWYSQNPLLLDYWTFPVFGSNYEDKMSWYRWRTPYNGFYYNKNSLSDPGDDLASFSKGERENYYLQKIETKTHIAYLITNTDNIEINLNGTTVYLTGSDEQRHDAWEAGLIEYKNAKNKEQYLDNENKMRRLERIELYVKSEKYEKNGGILTKKLQTTFFEYDYSLMQYINLISEDHPVPNSEKIFSTDDYYGKLTLKKVWTEYEDVSEDKISPYIFSYEYKQRDYPLVGNFSEYINYHIAGSSVLKQNPAYNPNNTDRWGSYQDDNGDGSSRKLKLNEWVDQTPSDNFDPAAWHLKEIGLPSGGEIHVYYEGNDYSYVQNRLAMVMSGISNYQYQEMYDLTSFEINCSDLGYDASEINDLYILMQSQFLKNYTLGTNTLIGKNEKLYFKFLFSLIGDDPNLNFANCKSDFIEGFVNVENIDKIVSGSATTGIKITCKGNPMRSLCQDYFSVKKSGKVTAMKNNCDPTSPNYNKESNVLNYAEDFINSIANMTDLIVPSNFMNYCKEVDQTGNSYVRIPSVKAKKGGGVRVKSIIMYDRFDECSEGSDANHAYGKEYLYQLVDGRSSGVATNEPKKGYEENPLNNYINTLDSKDWFKEYLSGTFLLAGDMKEEFSSPLGESLLPTPQIGYSRVVAKNIFEGMTDDGFTVKEFYTTKDYSFDRNYLLGTDLLVDNKDNINGVEYSNINKIEDKWKYFPGPIVTLQDIDLKLSQGYQFIQNSMNGQKKAEYSMGGSINDENQYISSSTEYEYFQPCEQIPVYNSIDDIRMEFLGREIEFFQEAKTISEDLVKGNGEADFVWNFLFVIPTFMPSYNWSASYVNNSLNSHVTTKVIRYPAIVKSITSQQDGIKVKTENIAFDRNTGQPVITRTTDEFNSLDLMGIGTTITNHDGSYYSYKFIAANEYESMSHKSDNEKKLVKSDYIMKFNKLYENNIHFLEAISYNKYDGKCIDLKEIFNEGDLINISKKAGYFYITSIQDNRIILEPIFQTFISNQPLSKVDINIIRSGKTNQLSSVAGNLVTYGQADEQSIKNNILFPNLPTSNVFEAGSAPNLEIARRQDFLTQLNTKINDAKSLGQSELVYNDPDLKIKSNDGKCEPVESIHISIVYNAPEIEICTNEIIYSIDENYDENPPLVSHLNDLLNDIWNKNLYLNLIQYKDWSRCTDCESFNGDTVSFQKHWTSQIKENASIIEKTNDLIGLKKIQETYYEILDTFILGSNIIRNTANPNLPLNDSNTYFYNVNADMGSLLIGKMNFEINGHKFEIVRQTDPYSIFCQDSSFTIDTLTLDTIYHSINDCVKYDCKNHNNMGFSFNKERPFWDAYMVLPFMEYSHRFICTPADSNLPEKNNKLMYDYMDLEQKFTERWGRFYCDTTDGWIYYKPLDSVLYNNIEPIPIMSFRTPKQTDTNKLCCFKFVPLLAPFALNYFKLDEEDGYQVEIDPETVSVGTYNECTKLCFEFCPDIYKNMTLEGVIKADAVTFSDDWENELLEPTSDKPYRTGNKGKWRPDESYVYNSVIVPGGNDVLNSLARTYLNSGVFISFENIFNWKYKDANYKWLLVNNIKKYNKNGNVIESSDILNIKNSQVYGYSNTLPIMTANNAGLNFIGFESFENISTPEICITKAHTGLKSYQLPSGVSNSIFDVSLLLDESVINNGFNIKAWFKTEYDPYDETDNDREYLKANINIFEGSIFVEDFNSDFVFKAQSGEWSLYEAKVTPDQFINSGIGNMCSLTINNLRPSSKKVWVDDIKISPEKSQSNCYVYNRNDFKVLASFDDQHYALIYQYNEKGDLIRKQIETERGLKTIAEAQYNTPKIDRDENSLDCSSYHTPMIETKTLDKNPLTSNVLLKKNKKYSITPSDLLTNDSLIQGSVKQEILDIKFNQNKKTINILESKTNMILPDSITKGNLDNNFNLERKFNEFKNEINQDSSLIYSIDNIDEVISDSLDYKNLKRQISDTLNKKYELNLDSLKQNKIKQDLKSKIKADALQNQLKSDRKKESKSRIKKGLFKDRQTKNKK